VSQSSNGPVAGSYFDHLVFVIMENEGLANICGLNATSCNGGTTSPYMSSLANSYGLAQQYLSLGHPSDPNYVGIMAGSIQNCMSGCGNGSIHSLNLVDRFDSAGLTWKAYMENQTPVAGCDNSNHEPYEYEHNPFVEFSDIDNNASRCSKIVLANPALNSTCTVTDCALIKDLDSATAPNFMWLTPNDCDNMHAASVCTNGCTTNQTTTCIEDGDDYLQNLIPNILDSFTFQHDRSALFVTFDEGNGFCPVETGYYPNGINEDCLYATWAGPVAKTSYSTTHLYDQYSLTKTIETNWSLAGFTLNDTSAIPMTEFFKNQPTDLTIQRSPGFTKNQVNPTSSILVPVGSRSNTTIILSSIDNLTGTVSLTARSSPTGPTITLSPTTVTLTSGGTGTSVLSVTSSTAGDYTVMVTGTTGSLSHRATVTVQVVDFSITANPSIITSPIGTNATSTITLTSINGYNGTINLSATVFNPEIPGSGFGGGRARLEMLPPSTLPGVLLSSTMIVVSAGGSGQSTLTVILSSGVQAGNYTVIVTATQGSLSHNVQPTVTATDPTGSGSSGRMTPSSLTTIPVRILNPGQMVTVGFLGLASLTGLVSILTKTEKRWRPRIPIRTVGGLVSPDEHRAMTGSYMMLPGPVWTSARIMGTTSRLPRLTD
jgi:phosphoesterase family protein